MYIYIYIFFVFRVYTINAKCPYSPTNMCFSRSLLHAVFDVFFFFVLNLLHVFCFSFFNCWLFCSLETIHSHLQYLIGNWQGSIGAMNLLGKFMQNRTGIGRSIFFSKFGSCTLFLIKYNEFNFYLLNSTSQSHDCPKYEILFSTFRIVFLEILLDRKGILFHFFFSRERKCQHEKNALSFSFYPR